MADRFLICGATGGVGAALTRRLHARGAALHLVARDAGKLEALAGETGATWSAGDLTAEGTAARVVAEAGGPLAGFAYCVGTITLKPFARLTAVDFLHDYNVNALSAAMLIQQALPALQQAEKASVVLFSSVAAGQGFAAHASIGMAKAAVEGLVRALAAELAPAVRINAVAPSLLDTPLAKGLTANARMSEAIARQHPLGRIGTADDAAAAAAFLLSAEADWITGQVLGVDGGRATIAGRG